MAFEHFPYTNFHNLNLDWVIEALQALETSVQDFVSINAIKYADPIQWDITSQYEKNTVVLDISGNAYLSVQSVPSGVSIDRTDFWTIIGNFSALWENVRSAISTVDEGHSQTASAARAVNTLVWVDDTLLEVVSAMQAGDAYNTTEGGNCREYTMQILLSDLLFEIQARQSADTALEESVSTLSAALDDETASREAADTTLQTSINSVELKLPFINAKYPPAGLVALVSDNVTDNKAALQAMIEYLAANGGGKIYIPTGNYFFSDQISITTSNIAIEGDGKLYSNLRFTNGSNGIFFSGSDGSPIRGVRIKGLYIYSETCTGTCTGLKFSYTAVSFIEETQVADFPTCIRLENATNTLCRNMMASVNTGALPVHGIEIGTNCISSVFEDCYAGSYSGTPNSVAWYISGDLCHDLYFRDCGGSYCGTSMFINGENDPLANDIHLENFIADAFRFQGVSLYKMKAESAVTISGGWFAPETTGAANQGIYLNECSNVSIVNAQFPAFANYGFYEGISGAGCTAIAIGKCLFISNKYGIKLLTSTGCSITGNTFNNVEGKTGYMDIQAGGDHFVINGNAFTGYSTYGIFTGNDLLNSCVAGNVIDPAHIENPVTILSETVQQVSNVIT